MPIDPEAARHRAEKAREREFRAAGGAVDPVGPRSTYAGEPSRPAGNYDPAYSPAGSPPPNYGAPTGYALDGGPRRGDEGPERLRGQNPLRGDGRYEVQPNDSYWTISERVYGSGAYFRALAEQNRGKAARPDRLPPGLVISTPPVAQLEKDFPDLCPRPNRRETVRNRAGGVSFASTAGGGRTYVVQEGDTLSSIARNELGKVSRWAEIYQLNREALGKDYDYLTPGLRLVLPLQDSQPGDRTTRRSDSASPLIR
jgi:nucleoid-associated protein YgaU